MSPVSQSSATLIDEKTFVQSHGTIAEHPSTAAEVPRPRRGPSLTDDPVAYFRRHRVTAPWLEWLDVFEPGINHRYFKSPRLVKFGTKTTADMTVRERYAWQKIFSWRKHDDGETGFRMRDGFHRVHVRMVKDERYISSYDGALKELVVQCTDDVFEGQTGAPWTRARMRDLSPFALRVADWCAWNVRHPDVSLERRIMRRVFGTILLFLPVSSPCTREEFGR